MKIGITNLPLHYGVTPRWLFERMKRLAREITIAIVSEYGPQTMIVRLSNPFWFQSFGCVLGFDWHSSGLTTTVTGALKEGLKDIERELGIYVCGGKGKTSLKTPEEIKLKANQTMTNSFPLVYASRLSAKVDNTALQDGYSLYHHTFFFTKEGNWAVIQQGMNPSTFWARRYHWLKDSVNDFVVEPHSGIAGIKEKKVLNLVAKESEETRLTSVKLVNRPSTVVRGLKKLGQSLTLPKEHSLFIRNLKPDSLNKILLKTYKLAPRNFEKLLGIQGVGPKTIRALSLISELIYGTQVSYQDPAVFSFAHGGKDGTPYPIKKNIYDQSIEILSKAINKIKVGRNEKTLAFKRLLNAKHFFGKIYW